MVKQMKFKVGDKIRRISNPVSICEVVIADPVCALYDIAGIPRAGYAVLYPDGTKSWDDFKYIEKEFELEEPMKRHELAARSDYYKKHDLITNSIVDQVNKLFNSHLGNEQEELQGVVYRCVSKLLIELELNPDPEGLP